MVMGCCFKIRNLSTWTELSFSARSSNVVGAWHSDSVSIHVHFEPSSVEMTEGNSSSRVETTVGRNERTGFSRLFWLYGSSTRST